MTIEKAKFPSRRQARQQLNGCDQATLSLLYRREDIEAKWQTHQNDPILEHPTLGKISPNQLRATYKDKPCPYCGRKMRHGEAHKTYSRKEARLRDYAYLNQHNKQKINNVSGEVFFHPHYVTLDHKLNKARFPELMFDVSNLEAVCWKCNHEKGDDNLHEISQREEFVESVANETCQQFPLL